MCYSLSKYCEHAIFHEINHDSKGKCRKQKSKRLVSVGYQQLKIMSYWCIFIISKHEI